MTDWTTMRPGDFDSDAQPAPLTLFPEPDRTGTPDLFTDTDDD